MEAQRRDRAHHLHANSAQQIVHVGSNEFIPEDRLPRRAENVLKPLDFIFCKRLDEILHRYDLWIVLERLGLLSTTQQTNKKNKWS